MGTFEMGAGTPVGPIETKPSVKAGELEQLGQEVLRRLSQEGLPPLPIHYELFFDKVLEGKPAAFIKAVKEQMEFEEEGLSEKSVSLEKKLKQGVSTTKEILQTISKLYKTLLTLQETIEKRTTEAKGLANPATVAAVTTEMLSEIQKAIELLKSDSNQLKDLYGKSLSIIKEAENETVYDSFYGIFNHRFFASMVEREVSNVARFRHQSSLLVLSLKESVVRDIGVERKILLVNRTIAKLLLKTSRRSDVIGHLGNGVFGMLLRHTDVSSAIKTAERVNDMISSTNLFLEDKEIDLKASIGILAIEAERSVEEILSAAIGAMAEAEAAPDAIYKIGTLTQG